ncbi:MAG: hypothetical protein EPO40_00595 [Myxococcaceae bacterium]|nr:MAG: hypothetical protein EPO40_00595 [Myxococcaceae bacterium]
MFTTRLRTSADPRDHSTFGLMFVPPTHGQIRAHLEIIMRERLPEDADFSPGSPLARVLEALTFDQHALWRAVEASYHPEPAAPGRAPLDDSEDNDDPLWQVREFVERELGQAPSTPETP